MCTHKEVIEEQMLREGAIKWSCTDCGKKGILLKDSKVAQYIKNTNEKATEIEFSKCENHKGENTDE